jgi:aspartyl-tRNA(Asn)/glutamyl-tRNA(Gln) amidotransferase subunit A
MTRARDKLEGILTRLKERAKEERVFLRVYDEAARIAASS